jgi:hypothetical protein
MQHVPPLGGGSHLIKGHTPSPDGVALEALPPHAQRLVGDMRAPLGVHGQPDTTIDSTWLADDRNLPALMRRHVFMAASFQAAGVKGVTLVPLSNRRLIHIVLDTRVVFGLLKEMQERAAAPEVWQPSGAGRPAPSWRVELDGNLPAQVQLVRGKLFLDRPTTLLQRGKHARTPPAQSHSAWKLGVEGRRCL